MSDLSDREFGHIEEQVKSLDYKIAVQDRRDDTRLKALEANVESLMQFKTSINVGIQILMWVGGGVLTVASIVTKFFGLLK